MMILTLTAIIIMQAFHYNTNINNNQDFNESVNRALDQTKDNITVL